jgi:hypothetical protein
LRYSVIGRTTKNKCIEDEKDNKTKKEDKPDKKTWCMKYYFDQYAKEADISKRKTTEYFDTIL